MVQVIIYDLKVFILDEFMDGLDLNQKKEVCELIVNLLKDKIVIILMYILEEVFVVCSWVIIILGGCILVDGILVEFEVCFCYYGVIFLSLFDVEGVELLLVWLL